MGAVGATINIAARFHTVPNDFAPAVFALGSEAREWRIRNNQNNERCHCERFPMACRIRFRKLHIA
jgi:hypothetical protein